MSLVVLGQQVNGDYLIRFSDTPPTTNSSGVSTILASHSASLEVTFQNGFTDGILKWRSFSCSGCDPEVALNELMDTGEFETWFHDNENVLLNCADCPNPEPYNDPLINGTMGHGIYPAQSTNWQVESIGANCAWDMTDNDLDPFVIAVVDTEIDETHPDLVGRVREVWRQPGYTPYISHGTQTSSMIVAGINNGIGTAGACDVCEVDVFSVNPSRSQFFTNGLLEAVSRGYRVINTSARWNSTSLFIDCVEAVESSGAIWVTGTANTLPPDPRSTSVVLNNNLSETVPGIIVVTGTRFDENTSQIAKYWSFRDGSAVDVMAPGHLIWRAQNRTIGGGDAYGINSGTSLSTPLVAAAAGMLLHSFPCLSAEEVENLIKEGANSDCLQSYNPDLQGGGHLNIAESLSLAGDLVTNNQDPVIISDPLTITDETIYYNNNLIVSGGGNLVVSNSTLRFAEGYGIIVEEDGNFTAFNSTLENSACSGEAWSGISVDGNAFKQGDVATAPGAYLNGSTVRNALTGIKDYGQSIFAHNKGVITVVNNVFENCRTSIASADPDQAPDITYNTIKVDDNYPHQLLDHVGVRLTYGAPGQVTQLGSNIFDDLRSDKEIGGTAISVYNASFEVGSATGSNGSIGGVTTISGYLHGIKAAEGSISNHLARVNNCESFNTTVSTWITGYNNPQVINNTFQAQSTEAYVDRFGALIPVQGIRMEMCRRHVVEGNTINGGLTASGQTYGIVVIGDAVAATRDAVYNNTLNTCQFGMLAVEENGGVDNISGLCYECNTFDGCETDIRAEGAISTRQQGVENGLTASAGNIFESPFMQFESLVTSVLYFIADPAEEPNPRINVNPVLTPTPNSCLPIFGVSGGGNPTCEDVAFDEFDTDRQVLEEYYVGGSISDEEAFIALAEFNRKYVMFTRELIDEVDECESGSVEQWGDIIQTSAPWQPMDETLVAVHEGNYSSATTKIEGLEPLAGQIEVDRLIGLIELAQDIQESSTDDEVEAAITNANMTAYLTESEISQSYAQTLARAAAESFGLVAYEARLSDPTDTENGGNGEDSQSLVLATPYELQNVTIYDALGRQIANPNPGNYLTIDGLNEALRRQPNGIYYVRGINQQGSIQTIAVSNVR